MAAEKFEQVVQALKSALERENDRLGAETVVGGLNKRFIGLADDYKNSEEFMTSMRTLLDSVDQFQNETCPKPKAAAIYRLIQPLLKELNANQKSTAPKDSSMTGTNGESATGHRPSAAPPSSNGGSARQRRQLCTTIARAEKGLKALEKEIKLAGQEELSIDDLDKDHTAFTSLLSLKSKYVRTAQNLAKLRKEAISVASAPVLYRGSGFPEIDNAVTKLIRPKLSARTSQVALALSTRVFDVPNYADLLQVVRQTNEKKKLGLSEEAIVEMSRTIGAQVSELLKEKTRQDLNECISEIVDTEMVEQRPTPNDPELEAKLKQNQEVNKRQVEQLAQKIQQQNYNIADDDADAQPADDCHESEASDDESESVESKNDEGNGQAASRDLEQDHNEIISSSVDSDALDKSGDNIVSTAVTVTKATKHKSDDSHETNTKKAKNEADVEVIDLSGDDD